MKSETLTAVGPSVLGSHCGEEFGYHCVNRPHGLDFPGGKTGVCGKPRTDGVLLTLRRSGEGTPDLAANSLGNAGLQIKRWKKHEGRPARCDSLAAAMIAGKNVVSVGHEA
ncbi:MAG: hypothetical protein HYY23_21795 [Verrucomicrobia bacterium]|nr:hypothetical protein [Verrucomicrobiota bacterium]